MPGHDDVNGRQLGIAVGPTFRQPYLKPRLVVFGAIAQCTNGATGPMCDSNGYVASQYGPPPGSGGAC